MPFGSFKEALEDGLHHGYAVGQFNINNLEWTQAIVEVANEENSPVILGASEGAIKYMGIEYMAAIAKAAADMSKVPIILHLDHGSSYDVILKCIRHGFTSVMIDGSHFPLEENIALTKKVVEACHPLGIHVEGELGRIGGVEDDLSVDAREATLVHPGEAERFVKETGIDAFAPAIGSQHGHYKGKPNLAFDRLAQVQTLTGIPLVLHGGTGIPDEDVRRAISLGVSKVNVNTENQSAFTNTVREIFDRDKEVFDPRKYLGPARAAIKDAVRTKIRLFGSNGRG
ncbi:MAG: class II fructose-1,6-bisphosphate aldolase [Acidibacillus sp.]|uniref:Fructose-bisphosphate aldolase n=1 Tax=Sulfoacidibacillus ferrooxidans TaxID=2005001 RepID=A0A9X1V8U3_9BACL|nr:class II fructose-1,6-bisphosphate aldolase [Sulfoacidibacillus ferrooxidans]MCI0183345.1 Fructose-bisphosphate aldolase [Sulfoacidibacillus ferrooxidans]MCY0893977.1 class II fructose-1,6-bisphosphate aldolase [Acidibacillus sp.]